MGTFARQSAGSRLDPVPDHKAKEPAAKASFAFERACPCTAKWCSWAAWAGWLGRQCQSRVSHAARCDGSDIERATTCLAENTDSFLGRLLFMPLRTAQAQGTQMTPCHMIAHRPVLNLLPPHTQAHEYLCRSGHAPSGRRSWGIPNLSTLHMIRSKACTSSGWFSFHSASVCVLGFVSRWKEATV